jgi:single-strand DNA-binding protein
MSYEVKGILYATGEITQRSEKFSTRQFTIKTTDEKYEQYITFELINDKTSLIDAFGIGEEITVSFNLRGREWKEKFFNTLEAWKVEGIF